jgi:uncharacterized protein YndB with AHSA1/START domain
MNQIRTHIDAPPESVWRELVDVERWAEWTPSMTRLEKLDPGDLRVGQRVRVKQPRLPTAVWRVTELEPNRSFSWSATSVGVTTTAGHDIVANRCGGSDVTHTVDQHGALAPVVRLLFGRLIRRYVEQEARGLKRRSESGTNS